MTQEELDALMNGDVDLDSETEAEVKPKNRIPKKML